MTENIYTHKEAIAISENYSEFAAARSLPYLRFRVFQSKDEIFTMLECPLCKNAMASLYNNSKGLFLCKECGGD